MKIISKLTGELPLKRFCVPGASFSDECPKCKELIEEDFGDNLDYPQINKPFDFDLYCSECDHEWAKTIILRMSLEPVG